MQHQNNTKSQLASFDIFDTTLIRKCGSPENIFYLLAHKLYPNDKAKREDFIVWRKGAESEARRRAPGKDVTIEDIYSSDELKGFGEYTSAQLIEAEKSIEAENLIANLAIRDVICKKRTQGYKICFISDMYMPSDFLKKVLEKEGCINHDEEVYVSCEWNARKSNGALYRKLKEELKPQQWEHFGDHPVSDYKMAKRHGIKATKVNTELTVTEMRTIQPRNKRFHYESSILAGLSRAARVHMGNDAYTTIAADIVAPAYIPYTLFIIETAKKRGIKTLYFLSRDSYILQRIAEQIPHEGIELRYLFVSRKALLLPYLHNATAEKFLAVQDKRTIRGKAVKDLATSLETSTEELKEKFGIEFNFDKIATKEQEQTFLSSIFGAGSKYLSTLNERAKKQRVLLNGYFVQEKVFYNDTTAMIDVGWLGTTRLMINSILKEEGYPETTFFYYGVRDDVMHCQHGEYYTFHSPATSDTELTFIIEDYFSASPYKSTNGYSKKNNEYYPILNGETAFNKTVSSNCDTATWIAREIGSLPPNILEYLPQWEEKTLDATKEHIHQIDKAPFIENGISRRLKINEFINVVFCGGHKTLYDKASIALTVPQRFFLQCWKIHKKTAIMRRLLATRIKR